MDVQHAFTFRVHFATFELRAYFETFILKRSSRVVLRAKKSIP